MNYQNEQLREALAAQYVLGTLRGSARLRFERWLNQDPDLQNRTGYWEQALQPLADQVVPVQPPSRVWTSIQTRLGMQASLPGKSQATSRLHWLRGAWVSFGLAALLVAVLVFGPAEEVTRFTPDIEVALQNELAQPVWKVDADSSKDTVVVSTVRNVRLPDDKSLELWLVLESGEPPISLGLMPTEQGRKYVVKSSTPLREGIGFAVSLEPRGGSPTGVATGPILYIQTYRET